MQPACSSRPGARTSRWLHGTLVHYRSPCVCVHMSEATNWRALGGPKIKGGCCLGITRHQNQYQRPGPRMQLEAPRLRIQARIKLQRRPRGSQRPALKEPNGGWEGRPRRRPERRREAEAGGSGTKRAGPRATLPWRGGGCVFRRSCRGGSNLRLRLAPTAHGRNRWILILHTSDFWMQSRSCLGSPWQPLTSTIRS